MDHWEIDYRTANLIPRKPQVAVRNQYDPESYKWSFDYPNFTDCSGAEEIYNDATTLSSGHFGDLYKSK